MSTARLPVKQAVLNMVRPKEHEHRKPPIVLVQLSAFCPHTDGISEHSSLSEISRPTYRHILIFNLAF